MSRTRHHGDKAKERLYGDEWRWYKSEPKWWNKEFHIKPRRQRERQSRHKVLRGDQDELWPLDKKPHKYYW